MYFNFAHLFYSSQDSVNESFCYAVAIQLSIKWGLRYRYKYESEKNAQSSREKTRFLTSI